MITLKIKFISKKNLLHHTYSDNYPLSFLEKKLHENLKPMKQPSIYIITNQNNTTLYTGVTSNLIQRIYQHKEKTIDGFSSKYNCNKLVYFEIYDDMENAILREKQIKGGSRQKKIDLIELKNPDWRDLYHEIIK